MDLIESRSKRTRRIRRPFQIGIAAVLLGVLAAFALVAGASSTIRSDKSGVIDDLETIGGIDSRDQKHLDKALKDLREGLADEFWDTEGNALAGKGEKVFRGDEKAIRELRRIDHGEVEAIIDEIVAIDGELARAAVDTAPLGPDKAKAEKSMDKAADALARGDDTKAVAAYGKAWKEADKARPLTPTGLASPLTLSGSVSGAKYSVYDVIFVRADTAGSDSPVFLSVSGSNEPGTAGETGSSNEGYLFDDAFGPTETSLDSALWPTTDGGIMQLHVSCSDVFAGGVGSKSDPAATSQWLINSIHIVKIKDGAVDKECDVVGAGLPTVPEEPPAVEPKPIEPEPSWAD